MPIDAILITAGGATSALAAVWFFFASRTEHEAELRGDMQAVTATVEGGYWPDRIRVRQGCRPASCSTAARAESAPRAWSSRTSG